jgi:hypothetical protein
MTDRTLETITINGNKYAKVSTRLAAYHHDHEKGRIETSCDFREGGGVVFSAKVTTSKGEFTGHSYGKVLKQKDFEKQESIAVGRALAFAGYLAGGEIACAEEMEGFVTSAQLAGLKVRFGKENAEEFKGLDKEQKDKRFNAWCREIVGEDVDYTSNQSWEPDWVKLCWVELTGVSEDVPFKK